MRIKDGRLANFVLQMKDFSTSAGNLMANDQAAMGQAPSHLYLA